MEHVAIARMGGARVGHINSLMLTKIDLLFHLWELIQQKVQQK